MILYMLCNQLLFRVFQCSQGNLKPASRDYAVPVFVSGQSLVLPLYWRMKTPCKSEVWSIRCGKCGSSLQLLLEKKMNMAENLYSIKSFLIYWMWWMLHCAGTLWSPENEMGPRRPTQVYGQQTLGQQRHVTTGFGTGFGASGQMSGVMPAMHRYGWWLQMSLRPP